MRDPSQQCPSAWREFTSPVRACGWPKSQQPSQPAVTFPIDRQYSKVCGRITAYQLGAPDTFARYLDDTCCDGISVTHGNRRHYRKETTMMQLQLSLCKIWYFTVSKTTRFHRKQLLLWIRQSNRYIHTWSSVQQWPTLGWGAVWRSVLQ